MKVDRISTLSHNLAILHGSELRKRHYGHRRDVRSGVGSHFRDVHGLGLDLQQDEQL